MNNSSSETLLFLLRAALGGKPCDASLPSDINWQEVIDLSFGQGVAAIAADGLQKIYEANPGLRLGIDEPEFRALKFEWRGRFDRDIDRFEFRRFFDALDGVADYVMGEKSEMTEAERLMLEDILAPKDVRQFKSKFLARLNILRMIWVNRWKYGYYSETTASAVMFRYVYGHFFDRDVK